MLYCKLIFFFQAEDGIRDTSVTGVQTCALPISGERNCRIHAKTKTGEIVTAHKIVTLAEIEKGMSDAELEEKFRRCVARTFDTRRADAVLAAAGALDRAETVDSLVDLVAL